MREIIRVKDQYYILATSSLADDRTRVLKQGETFAVFDRYGDIHPLGLGEQGIYHQGMRHLSRLALRLQGSRPLLLSSTVREDNVLLAVDLANPDLSVDDEVAIPRGTLHIHRSKFLWQGVCHERLVVRNYGLFPVEISLELEFEADFADVFEVRGVRRARRGERWAEVAGRSRVVLNYDGLDGARRCTTLECSPPPSELSGGQMRFPLHLPPRGEAGLELTIACEAPGAVPPRVISYQAAYGEARETLMAARAQECRIYTTNEQFNDWLNRSLADLHMMITPTPQGPYPYAGVPWFNAPFGRDGIITALEYLWVNPTLAKGVLAYLASTQAKELSPERDAEPGKILHEARFGEMAALGEVPFGRYYGSVDATPLFVMLAGAYYERTGDLAFIEAIWPNIELALEWIDRYGDLDGDGFVEYARRSPRGLVHQGWKDSADSVFHADGSLAEGPIALCEVQAYVYAAKRRAAWLAEVLGRPEQASRLWQEAERLRERFEEAFWCEELGTYALALDGRKRPCRVRTSNAGHCLLAGIASPERARRTAETLLSEECFSGWGIRTVAASEARYNPMSYHNGSVWPHDNALIAYGMSCYDLKHHALRVMAGLFDATLFLELSRLPELFCGFGRRPGEGPTLYPVACNPQAWASAAVFLLLQACLGLSIDAPQGQIRFCRPLLPEFLQGVRIENLRVGRASVDLFLQRQPQGVGIEVLRREGDVEIVAIK